MKIPSQILPITRLKRGLGLDELNHVVELFPAAAILVDRHNLRIVMANSKALELSAFMRNELTNKRLRDLFSNDPGQSAWEDWFTEQASVHLTLVRHNKSSLDVRAKFDVIAADGHWIMMSFEPVGASQKRETDRQRYSELLEQLRNLTDASQQPDLEGGLKLVLKVGQILTSATGAAIYQVNSPNMVLKLLASIGSSLPEELPSQDMIHLRSPQVWVPGKRSHTYLHGLAKAAGLTYLASVPIGDSHAIIGVLVFSDTGRPPVEQAIPLLHILAGSVHNIIQHFSKVSHLNAELEEQKSFQRFVDVAQDAIRDGIIVLNHDYKVLMINQAAELCLGYKVKEAQNLHVQDILIGGENLLPALRMAQQGIPTLQHENISLIRRSGDVFLANISTLPVKHNNQVEGIIILIQDQSEQEKARTQAEQLQQHALLGTVTAIFAHEVRNPLHSLSAGLQLMAYQLPLDDPQRDLIVRMQADCDRLEELMKNVLIFSRSTEYEMEPVDLGMLVSRQLDRMRPRIASANVKPHLNTAPNTPLIMGNPRALEQVFTNLFTNAIQAMEPTGGVLGVKVQLAETTGKRQYALVTVADNGPGIPKENLDHIFQPFFTTKSSGTGLGLAITQRIVAAHKGLIQASSIPGATMFTVQIPAIQPPNGEL